MFITFEGIDGCGKTTQIRLLEESLKKNGINILSTRQPGGTNIGRIIRNILLNPENSRLVPEAEVLLYLADRIQHIKEIILPALQNNQIVLCDRYHDATLAYQGGGRQLDLDWLKSLQQQFVTKPDLTFWLDISVEESQTRLNHRNTIQNTENCRLESENTLFFSRVSKAYHDLCHQEPDRFIRILAEETIDTIRQKIFNIVWNKLV